MAMYRDTGAGGDREGVVTCRHNLEAVGAAPPTLDMDINVVLFYLFVFAHELGSQSLPKK